MPSNITNAMLAEKVSDLLNLWKTRETQMVDWISGDADGGPYGDGRFPLADYLGTIRYTKSPAALEASVSGSAASSGASAADAVAAAVAAASAKVAAESARDLANSYKALAQTASSTAAVSKDEAVAAANLAASYAAAVEDAADSSQLAIAAAAAAQAAASAASASETNAATSESSAAASAALATSKATQSAADATDAETASAAASTAATTATTKASEASSSASSAASSETTASTKASEAATSASNAAASASTASSAATTSTTKASEAATSATSASTSAATASTKAGEASASASTASSAATTATTKASEAVASATSASTSASTASSAASTATTQAGSAASSASAANTSASNASTSEANAANSADDAAASVTAATTQVGYAASYATAAGASAALAASIISGADFYTKSESDDLYRMLSTAIEDDDITSIAWSKITGITGTPTGALFLRDDGSWQAIPNPTFANPSGSIGLTANNGSASTYMRSDATPSLSQAITPTWTAQHVFSGGNQVQIKTTGTSINPLAFFADGQAAGSRAWMFRIGGGGDLQLNAADDSGVGTAGGGAFDLVRSGANLTELWFGNTTSNPKFVFQGTGLMGLGTSSPTAKLEVTTGSLTGNAINARFNASNAPIGFGVAASNGFGYLGWNTKQVSGTDNQTYDISLGATRVRMDGSTFVVANAPSGTAGNAITWTDRLSMNATGSFTIAAPSSGTGLTVNGLSDQQIRLNAATGQQYTSFYLQNNSVTKAGMYWDNVASEVGLGGFIAGSSTRITAGAAVAAVIISPTGNVSVSAPSSGTALTVAGASGDVTPVRWTDAAGTTIGFLGASSSPSIDVGSVSNHPLNLYSNSALRVAVAPAGNVTINAPSSGVALTLNGSGAALVQDIQAGGHTVATSINGTSTNGYYQRFQKSGTQFGYIGCGAATFASGTLNDFGMSSDSNLVLATNGGIKRVIIDSAGAVKNGAGGSFLSHGSSSYPSGTITVSSSAPSGGSDGDFWVQV